MTDLERGKVILPVTEWWYMGIDHHIRLGGREIIKKPICPYCGAKSAWYNDCSVCHKRFSE